MTVVCKFGGTSCADGKQIRKIAAIIKENRERKYIVVSAPGKRFDGDIKVTDLLVRFYETGEQALLSQIAGRFEDIIDDLSIPFDLKEEIEVIQSHAKIRDYIISRGEYLNAKIIAAYLGWQFIDSRDCFEFGKDRKLMTDISYDRINDLLNQYPNAVFPGFYGSDEKGSTVTFPRGGSDITGSVIARAIHASVYENWTDVSGILAADPHIVDHPRQIDVISYEELRELSYMGASVLQEDAVFPVRSEGIPIVIRNTNVPENKGTRIVKEKPAENHHVITGIAGKKGFVNIQIEKAMMNSEIGFGSEVLKILAEYGISYEHMPTTIDTMSVLVQKEQIEGHRMEVLHALQEKLSPDALFMEDGIALIAVVGEGIAGVRGFAAKLLQVISDAGINIRMIDVGFSEVNIIIGIDEENYQNAIQTIYRELYDFF